MTKPNRLEWVPGDEVAKITEPSSSKKIAGWIYKEKMPFQYLNWLFNLISKWVSYFDGENTNPFSPSESSVPAMNVLVGAGKLYSGGILLDVAAQTTGTITAPAINPRIDRIVMDSSGVSYVISGSEAASPLPPSIPSNRRPVAQVLLTTTTTEITNLLITDERSIFNVERTLAKMTASSWQASAIDLSGFPCGKVVFNEADKYFVAGSSNGNIMSKSRDGVLWNKYTKTNTSGCLTLGHNGSNLFIAAASSGTPKVESSADAQTWIAVTVNNTGVVNVMEHDKIGLWVSGGQSGFIETSPDGITFTTRTGTFGGTETVRGGSHNGVNLWTLVGDNGHISTSPNGINWTQQTSPSTEILFSVEHDKKGRWVACSNTGQILTSTDGINWSLVTSPFTESLRAVRYNGNGVWLVTGSDVMGISFDGINWEAINSGLSFGESNSILAYGNGMWIADANTIDIALKTNSFPID